MTATGPLSSQSKTPGDVLATAVWNICIEGEENEWVSGLPPDARQRLDAAVNEYCDAEQARVASRPERSG